MVELAFRRAASCTVSSTTHSVSLSHKHGVGQVEDKHLAGAVANNHKANAAVTSTQGNTRVLCACTRGPHKQASKQQQQHECTVRQADNSAGPAYLLLVCVCRVGGVHRPGIPATCSTVASTPASTRQCTATTHPATSHGACKAATMCAGCCGRAPCRPCHLALDTLQATWPHGNARPHTKRRDFAVCNMLCVTRRGGVLAEQEYSALTSTHTIAPVPLRLCVALLLP